MTKQELLDKANDLPLAPGVYLMMDKTGCVIYVGKAKKLKNRVSQYFQENSSHNEKTRRMVSQVDHFDTIFVSTEFEALILENSLIKQHMPRYNILLKDDKGYPFVRLGTEHYPRFTMVGKPADDNALYFGPFGGRNETRAAIDAICAAFRLPTCSRKFPRDIGKERPCLNHHMGRCDAFCRGTPDEDEYMRRIGQAEELLNGHYRRLTRVLREEMEQEAADLHFEQAAALRDRIRAIEVLGKRQKVIAGICADTDIWGVYRGALKCGSAVTFRIAPEKYPSGTLVDLNRADTTELKKIPGIGSGIARLIIGYRQRLGGFYNITQLQEIHLDTSQLQSWFSIDTRAIHLINLNRSSIERLRHHPYINFYQAKAFVEYRKKKGDLHSLKPFALYEEFSDTDLEKISHYVCFE